ncbi:mitochondrial 37S ribosomal protein mS29 ASCRUDRAFT_26131, partial [Ascoidea rubescens DSM 1968]
KSESKILKFSPELTNTLTDSELLKNIHYKELFHSPIQLFSKNDSQTVLKTVQDSLDSPSIQNRLILLGEKGLGKSTLLSQVFAYAISNNSVILPISKPEPLIQGDSDYNYIKDRKFYSQPMYLKKFFRKILKINHYSKIFQQIVLSNDYLLGDAVKFGQFVKFPTGKANLLQLIEFAASAKISALDRYKAFEALISELNNQDQFPVFILVDNFNYITNNPITMYRSPDNVPLKFTEFQLGSFLKNYISGDKSFPKGGVFLATSSDYQTTQTLSVGLDLQQNNPYASKKDFDLEWAEILRRNGGIKPYNLKGFSYNET